MKIVLEPVQVSHVSIKALLLYEQELAQEYQRLVTVYSNLNGMGTTNKERYKPLKAIQKEMLDCQKTREYLEKHYINNTEPIDKTEY